MNTTAQVKQAIKKSAQQLRQEPLELLKSATKQITGTETTPWDEKPQQNEVPPASTSETQSTLGGQDEQKYKKQVAEQDGRRLQALESEILDISRQKLFSGLMTRIQAGEEIPLEEFTELSFEQRDVLKAQEEAVKKQKAMQANQSQSLPDPGSKKGRKMGGGQKGAAKKEETRVEKPVPPSG